MLAKPPYYNLIWFEILLVIFTIIYSIHRCFQEYVSPDDVLIPSVAFVIGPNVHRYYYPDNSLTYHNLYGDHYESIVNTKHKYTAGCI